MKKMLSTFFKASLSFVVSSSVLGFGLVNNFSNQVKAAEEVTLKYASWDTDQAEGLRKVLDEFEKQNPGIKVEMETTPWDQYWVKLEAAATGGNMADVVTMHSAQSYKYMSNDILMDLNPVIESENIDMESFTEGIADFYTYQESVYGIPKDASVVGLWFNKTMFDEAGLEYPNSDWTWDDLLENAKKLTDLEKGIYGFAADNGNETGFWPFVYQAGGQVYSEDGTKSAYNSEEVKKALQFYTDLSQVHKVSPDVTTLQETNKIALFQSGKLAMMIEGNWHTVNFANNDYTKEHAGVAVLPKDQAQATIINGLAWSASANTKYPEETKKLIAFLASDEANKIQAETGASIPAKKGFAEDYVNSITEMDLSAFNEMLDYGVPRPYSPLGANCEAAEKEVLNSIFSGQKSVEEGAAEIEQKVNEILSELE